MTDDPRVGPTRRTDPWAVAAATWWLSILLLLPAGRPLVEALRERHLLAVAVVLAMGLVFALVAVVVGRLARGGRLERRQVLVVVLATGLLVLTAQLWSRPEERWHVVQYGLLGLLFFLALPGRRRRAAEALLLAVGAGWFDEGIQLILPDRVYDLRDVGLNAGAAAAGVLVAEITRRLGATEERQR